MLLSHYSLFLCLHTMSNKSGCLFQLPFAAFLSPTLNFNTQTYFNILFLFLWISFCVAAIRFLLQGGIPLSSVIKWPGWIGIVFSNRKRYKMHKTVPGSLTELILLSIVSLVLQPPLFNYPSLLVTSLVIIFGNGCSDLVWLESTSVHWPGLLFMISGHHVGM